MLNNMYSVPTLHVAPNAAVRTMKASTQAPFFLLITLAT
jgi:hypothetical protein